MKDIYEIEKPSSDLNYLTIVIKYIVLFIVFFLASWFAIPLLFANGRSTRVNKNAELLFENPLLFSALISIGVISWFIYRTRRKYKLGEVFQINFNDSDQKLEIKTVNLANNMVKDNYYDYQNLSYYLQHTQDSLFGKQRILTIKNYGKTVHQINFDRTAWCRNERIEHLIEKTTNLTQQTPLVKHE